MLITESVANSNNNQIAFHFGVNSVHGYVRNVKLEKGTKATDWTPAPEDVDKKISDVQIVDHKRLMNNVYQTTYESGKSIIVNYNWEPVQVYHRVIEGKDFTVMEGIDYED